ncbi:hypothetical protein [Nocardia sp. NPDC057227]|uniref:hypothetical protein n=1 Tax=Nocardia sp. NPDC057227 TaxID=3346056 RepID=UPI0036418FE5
MSAWEYRSKAAALLTEEQASTPEEIAGELIGAGYVQPVDRAAVAEELAKHDGIYLEDDTEYCECGKWLEREQYEWPDHVEDMLDRWITEAGRAERTSA